jgi:hypothetical protein
MKVFDERERGFENKFAHDAELVFRIYARRNRLLGEWAADLLGKTGAERDAYAREVVLSDLKGFGHESDAVGRVSADLREVMDERTIKLKVLEFHEAARGQLLQDDDAEAR